MNTVKSEFKVTILHHKDSFWSVLELIVLYIKIIKAEQYPNCDEYV